jgi:hypothetical protein
MADSASSILASIKLRLSKARAAESGLVKDWQRFGVQLREERKRRKIKRAVFADLLGFTPTMLSYLEHGSRKWSLDKAELAVRLLTRRVQWPE